MQGRFLAPPPPPPLPPPPPAHMPLFSAQADPHAEALVMIKSEPSDESLVVHNNNFHGEFNDENTSSHEEILNSEFGQTVREIVPSGRTVLGT